MTRARFHAATVLAVVSLTCGSVTATRAADPEAAVRGGGAEQGHAALCKADEVAYAGCTFREPAKMVAICVAKGTELTPTPFEGDRPGWRVPKARFVSYRFGRPGAVELDYPKDRAGSAAKFRYRKAFYARGSEQAFRFARGSYEYTYVFRMISRGPNQGHDVTHLLTVMRGAKRVSQIACTDHTR